MKIAIDINDVVRDFSNNFVRYYIEGYDHKFDLTDFEFWSNDLSSVFPATKNVTFFPNFISAELSKLKVFNLTVEKSPIDTEVLYITFHTFAVIPV